MTARVLAVLFVFLLTLVASANTSPAQVVAPTAPGAPLTSAFTYQGSLLSGGAAASGAFDFQCIPYDAASGGSQVGPIVTLDDVPVAEGIFTVQLDFGAAAFTGPARWLEVGVRPGASTAAYTILSPRHPLTAVPYALWAQGSAWAGLSGVPAASGDAAGTYPALTVTRLQGRPVASATPGSGQVLKWNGSQWGPAADEIGAVGTGDITAVNAGMGLTGGGTAVDVTLAADTTVLQRRVTGTCAVGSSMRVVNGDGTVACEADDNTTYSTGPDSTNTYYDPWWYPQPGGNVDSFNVRATGGVYLVTSVDDLTAQPTAGVFVTGGGSGWNSYSDRNAKENVVPADGRAILDRLAAIPVQTWNYKTQAPAIRHIGPMAQDFAAAFAVGENDTTINSIDADGVALAAIPGLYQVVQEQDARLAAQQEKIQALEAQNAGFEQRLAALEQRAGAAPAGLATLPATLPWAGGLVLALAGLGARRLAGGGR